MNQKLVVFSPFSNVWDHTYPEALITSGLARLGWDIAYLNCNGILDIHCVAMSAAGVNEFASPAVRSQICRACHKRRDLTNRHFGFQSSTIEDFLAAEDRTSIDAFVASVTPATWTELTVDGFPLGRYAVYEMWLHNKLVSPDLPPELWPIYLGQLRNTLTAYFASLRFLSDTKPDVAMVYNDHYSVNHAFTAAAKKLGITSYSIHGGWHMVHRSESMSMMRSDYTLADLFESPGWSSVREEPLNKSAVDLVAGHFDGLWAANSAFAYSSELEGTGSQKLRSQFGIAPEASVLLAAMSSEDELMGVTIIGVAPQSKVQKSLFSDQFEWIKFLIQFASTNPEYHLIVRLHPRMFPNKRELKMSPVVSELMELKAMAPGNITFNVPSDNVSLYDLIQIVDVVLNFRSSAGAELMALGLPVVVPANSNFYSYPNELNRIAHTKRDYEKLIRQAAKEGWSVDNARKAFRWYGFFFGRVSASFSETYTSRPTSIRPKKPGFRLWLWTKAIYVILQHGPLILERLALRRGALPTQTIRLFDDVLKNDLDTVSDSRLFASEQSSVDEETRFLEEFFTGLLAVQWKDVDEENSLAGRVRAALNK
ncbi:MAG: hypothetical protein K9H50_01420 [Aurantimicrobium sp.]|nr:hypothetical protein [Aurantimicrobium sp.]